MDDAALHPKIPALEMTGLSVASRETRTRPFWKM